MGSSCYIGEILGANILRRLSERSQSGVVHVNRFLNRLCKACDSGLEVARFQGNCAKRSGGPKFIVDDIAAGFFLDIFRREKQVRLKITTAPEQ